MKDRSKGFLADEYCPDVSEIGDYISELHGYLWRVIYVIPPNAGGKLQDYLDIAMRELEARNDQSKEQDND